MSRGKNRGRGGKQEAVAPTVVLAPFIPEYKSEHFGAEGDKGERSKHNMVEDHKDLDMHATDTLTTLQYREKKGGKKSKKKTTILDSEAAIEDTYVYPETVYLGAMGEEEKRHRLSDVPGIDKGINLVISAHGNPKEIGGKTLYSVKAEELADLLDLYLASTLMQSKYPNLAAPEYVDTSEMEDPELAEHLLDMQEMRRTYEENGLVEPMEDVQELTEREEIEAFVEKERIALRKAYMAAQAECDPTALRIHIDLQTCNSAYFPIEEYHQEAISAAKGRYNSPVLAEAVKPNIMEDTYMGRFWKQLTEELDYTNVSVSGYRGYTGQRSDKKNEFSVTSKEGDAEKRYAKASETMYSITTNGIVVVPRQWKFDVEIAPEKLLDRDTVFQAIQERLGNTSKVVQKDVSESEGVSSQVEDLQEQEDVVASNHTNISPPKKHTDALQEEGISYSKGLSWEERARLEAQSKNKSSGFSKGGGTGGD